jgi:hypothetical protein
MRRLTKLPQFTANKKHRVNVWGKDLPLTKDYEYEPRPPEISIEQPRIQQHMWTNALYQACQEPCNYTRYLPFHECELPFTPGSTAFLDCIPKKTSRWAATDGKLDDAWGIMAMELPSALGVLVYHTVIFAGPMSFWIWWSVCKRGDRWDMSNASIPLSAIVSLVSLFWGLVFAWGAVKRKVE